MHLDPDQYALTFDDIAELRAFHEQLGALLREATIAASSSSPDAAVATERVRDVLDRFATVTEALNHIRASSLVSRTPG